MILAGDIGGTKTVLALFDRAGEELRQIRDGVFSSKEHESLEEILAKFMSQDSRPALEAACFGVAGAVIDGKCRTTNLPWELDERALAATVAAQRGKLLNDLEAAAYGMLFLPASDTTVLNPGAPPERQGNIAVIAAGTGLGEAILYWDGERYQPLASEGGHADFAPQTDQEIALLQHLRKKFSDHVSYERVLSGPGFYNVYEFLRDSGHAPEPDWLRERLKGGDPSAIISQAGVAREDALCAATVDLFCSIYGAEAGNLALKCVAVSGVFVGGGIAPKMLPALRSGAFMRGFTAKGRFTKFMTNTPVRVALNPRAPLMGAAHYALRL